jgi:mannose/cellobiose epimerase-like protein (N-acyl-D-glucosamine 2-epimerase family)
MTDAAASRIRAWLVDKALPLWAGAGVDPRGGFAEALDLAGEPLVTAPKRVRVQARQIYVYSHAALLGLWPDGARLARAGWDFVRRHAWLEGGGVAHLLGPDGFILDRKRDTYDQAFMLLALGWLCRAAPDPALMSALYELADSIERNLRHPIEGYREDDAGGLPRRQNPHMHLFEAFLSAHAATGDPRFLERAGDIYGLFQRRFFDADRSALIEHFTDDLVPVPGDMGTFIEPGHHFEWAWLLQEFGRLAGQDMGAQARALYDFAARHGRESKTGLAYDEVWIGGGVKKASKRCWPQTEALKAEIALADIEGRKPGPEAAAILDLIFRYYLDGAIAGGWNDVVDATNRPLSTTIPASTLYHLFLAFAEYLRVAKG